MRSDIAKCLAEAAEEGWRRRALVVRPQAPAEYWASGVGLATITPRAKVWPEGDGFPAFLRGILGARRILEFGCGVGRLASILDADRYIGVDICPAAIERARALCPRHELRAIGVGDQMPEADATLCHTVLLHVPDDTLAATVGRFRSQFVIVSEILGRHWRRDGGPPVFNREVSEYEAAFDAAGYGLLRSWAWPYPHYRDTDMTLLEFERC